MNNMNRRELLTVVGAAAFPTALAGCTTGEQSDLEVTSVETSVTDSNAVEVSVRVENNGDAIGEPTIAGAVRQDGDVLETETEEASIAPLSNAMPTFTDVLEDSSHEDYTAAGRIDGRDWVTASET